MRRNSNHELFDGLYYGLGVGLLVWWRYRPDSSLLTQVIILVFCLVFFGFVGLLVGLVTGVGRSFESIYEAIPNRPNEGIRRSLQDGFIGALLVGLFWGLLAGLPSGLVSGPSVGLSWGLFVGLLSGVFGGLRRYGGKAVIQHYILRSMLSRSGAIPLRNLVPMLEEARRRRLLVRVGGGYKFFHEEIQKYYTARSPVLDVVGPKLKAISQVVEQEQA